MESALVILEPELYDIFPDPRIYAGAILDLYKIPSVEYGPCPVTQLEQKTDGTWHNPQGIFRRYVLGGKLGGKLVACPGATSKMKAVLPGFEFKDEPGEDILLCRDWDRRTQDAGDWRPDKLVYRGGVYPGHAGNLFSELQIGPDTYVVVATVYS